MSRARTLNVLLMYFVVNVQVFMFLTVDLESCICTGIQDILPRKQVFGRIFDGVLRASNWPCSKLV